MAKGKNEILLSIALEGDADVKAKLKAVGEEGKRSMADIEKRLGGAGEGIGRNLAKQVAEPFAKVREALAPFLEGAGLSAAGGGLIPRLFGAAGPAAAVAGVSAIALHLAKVSEDLQRQQGRLKALGDSNGFEKISGQAKQLGTNVSDLQPRYEKFLAFQQKANAANRSVTHPLSFEPGQAEDAAAGVQVLGGGTSSTPPSRKAFGAFDSALFSQVRRDVKSAEEAHAIVGQFEDGLAQSGLTGDSLRSLQQQAPHAANFIKDSLGPRLGRGFANPNELATLLDRGGAQVSAPDLINAGAKAAPEADKAAEAARGVSQAFDGLKASVGRLDEAIGKAAGGPVNKSLTGLADQVTGGVDKAAGFVERSKESIQKGAEIGGELGSHARIPLTPLPVPFGGTVGGIVGGALGGAAGIGGDLARSAVDTYVPDFLKKALTNPGALQEKVRPAEGPSALQPPVPGLGIRGSLEDASQSVASVKDAGAQLAAVIYEVAQQIKSGSPAANSEAKTETAALAGGGSIRRFPGGGGVSGPGSTTSDSIPAMLSDKEYVIKAESARKIGRAKLDWLNAGNFAGGGHVARLAGGGTLDDRLLDGWRAAENRRLLEDEAKAAASSPSAKRWFQGFGGTEAGAPLRTTASEDKSPGAGDFKGSAFVGDFDWEKWQLSATDYNKASGGPIGRFAGGGMVSFPGFDIGGSAMMGEAPSLADLGAGAAESLHPVTINFEGRPVGGLRAPGDVVDTLRKEARDSANFQTGPAPSWAHGT